VSGAETVKVEDVEVCVDLGFLSTLVTVMVNVSRCCSTPSTPNLVIVDVG